MTIHEAGNLIPDSRPLIPERFVGLKICLAGPLPPPAGGMANQMRQLSECLRAEGAVVEPVQ
ncbi:MAG: hypothetical protein LBE06_02770, partial [Azoarcus sp.]|nr:hypothetical protein [Azoarcus sp.]